MARTNPPDTNRNRDHVADKKRIEDLIKANNPAAAKGLCENLCRQNREDPHAWFLMSAIHALLGDYADAERCCREVIARVPQLPMAHFNRGIALQHLKRTDEAIDSFREATRLKPDYLEAWVSLGDALKTARQTQQACDAYRAAARLRPDIPEIHARLAAVLRESGELAEAEQSLQQAVRLNPKSVPAMMELGRLKIQRQQYPEAIAVFREVLSIDRTCKEAYQQIGSIEISLGNVEAAAESYGKILEFAPEDVVTRILVTRMLASRGLLERAEGLCHQGLTLGPDNVPLLCELGKIFSEQGRVEEARKCFQKAKELEPGNTAVEYFLSELDLHKDAYMARQRHIREIFDGYADSFDTHLQEKLEYRIPDLLARVLQETGIMERRGLNVIDLGCGTGLCGPLFRNVAARLVGVDLSPRMLEKAGERRVYDELREADIIDALQNSANAFDLVLAADVFVYVGDLAPVFVACSQALRQGGLFAFSVESVESGDFLLRASGRYGQSPHYIRKLAEEYGFEVAVARETVIRKEGQQPIPGHVFVLNKKPDRQP